MQSSDTWRGDLELDLMYPGISLGISIALIQSMPYYVINPFVQLSLKIEVFMCNCCGNFSSNGTIVAIYLFFNTTRSLHKQQSTSSNKASGY